MYDKYVNLYVQEILDRKCSLSQGLFHAEYIASQYEWEIWGKLEELGIVHPKNPDGTFNKEIYNISGIEWDDYDNSIELMDCIDEFTLTTKQRDAIYSMGFAIIFVNYKNGPHLYGNKTAAMDAMPVIKDD